MSNVDLTNVQFVSASSLQAVVPAGLPAGPHDLTVTNPDGGAATRNAAFTAQAPAPTLASVSPAAANAGDEITLQGANFVSGAVVRIGAATVPSSVLAADQALATVPAGTAPGVYSVSITNPDGQSASLSNALTVTTLQTVSHTTLADFNAGTFASTQAVDGGNAGDGAVMLFSNGFVDLFDAPTLDSSVWASGVYTTGGAVGQSGGALSVSGAWARGRSVVPSGVFTARLTFTNSAWQNVGFSREDQLDDPWLVFGVPGWDTTRVFARINVGATNADIPLTGLIGAPHDYTIEYSGTQVRFLVDGVQVHQATIPNPGFMAPWISQGSIAEPIIVEQAALASYVSSGTYLSASLDAGADADWVQFVTQRTQPGGTTLRGRARSSVDGSTFSDWTGWSAAQQFDLAVPAGRYLQYELELTTSAATATPLVSSVAATYQPSGGPQAASVVVTPASATVQAGMTQQFAATVLDSAGQPIDGAAVTWDVVSGGGTVNSTGLFTAGSATGTFTNTVVATSNGVSGSASVTVSPLPPTITGVSPTSGPTTGNTDVTLSGTNFETGAIVRFGANAATNVSVSPTTITARTPVGTAGTVDVSVSMPSGATATLPGGYTYTAVPTAPVVSGVSPNSGPTTGGTTVTVTGSGFSGTTQVRFGTTNAPNYTVDSDEQITVISPSRSSGTVNIRVTNSVGVSPATAPSQYTYVPAPSISGVSPSSGPTTGGTQVNINGANFQPGATARFGDVQLTVVSSTSSRITVTTPPADAGLVDVIVTNPDGGQAIRSGGYRYVVPAPVVLAVEPNTGPTAGGTSVVITGQYFTGATQVRFGATTTASFVVDSDSQITVISPSRSAGVVSVRVTTPSGTSPSSGAPTFTYIAPPNITAVSPNTGPAAGGTSVAITGTSFNEATAVHFGTVPATSFVLESTTRIVAVSPPQAAGRIDIRVTTPYGQSVIRSADRFTYV
ncbi:MAG: hypothetical protein DCC58_14445 [Chloroflexi bacterium]|nr:MAG: hypothetical protein DCC58_14445 [Chloroflexota bacterium]